MKLFNPRKEHAASAPTLPAQGGVDTIVGRDTEFKGTLVAKGIIRVEGRVEGEIVHDGDMVVGEAGVVNANIKAANLTVAGEITGDVDITGKLELLPTARVYGDIVVTALIVAAGATFEGRSTMRTVEDAAAGVPPTARSE